jgi:hypothetical protein
MATLKKKHDWSFLVSRKLIRGSKKRKSSEQSLESVSTERGEFVFKILNNGFPDLCS